MECQEVNVMKEQEQIEQMASDVEDALHNHCRMLISCSCNDCEFLKYRTPKTDCQAMCIAKNLYNKNYQKIDDDCIVITKDELKQYKEQAVKEFAEMVKEKALSNCRTINCYELRFIETTIDELLTEYEK